MRECTFVSGLCQSRKTQKTLDVLAKLTTPQESTLLLYITQSGSTLNAFQVVQRIRAHDILKQCFPCVKRARKSESKVQQSTAIVDYYHTRNISVMLHAACALAHPWHTVLCVIDEADQGGLSGFQGRLAIIRSLDESLGLNTTTHLHVIFVTATAPNLSRLFAKMATEAPLEANNGMVDALLNGTLPVKHEFVTPHEDYVSMEWFRANKCIRVVKEKGKNETPAIELSECVEEELKELTHEQRKLVLVSFTNSKSKQMSAASKWVTNSLFDIAVCLNSDNAKNYVIAYRANNQVQTWALPYDAITRAADKGTFARHLSDSGACAKTGIESGHDISLSQVLVAALFTNADFAARVRDIDMSARPAILALRQFLMKKWPPDFPETVNARVAIIGGNMLSRGITIQAPHLNFTCTAFVLMDAGRKNDAGASHTQKAGRALGNLRGMFEGGAPPVMVLANAMFVSAMTNERLTYEKGRASDGAFVQMGAYITKAEYCESCKNY